MPRQEQQGNGFALLLLLIFIALLSGAMYYLAAPSPQAVQASIVPPHTYFEGETFSLPVGQTWRVGVPVAQDGTLHLSISTNSTVQLYVKNGNSYLLNNRLAGGQNFTLPVPAVSGVLEVGVTNVGLGPALVEQFTCIWTAS